MNEISPGAGLTALFQGLGIVPSASISPVWVFVAFPLLLIWVALKFPEATHTPSFFSAGVCLGAYFFLSGIMNWTMALRGKPDNSTLGFLGMLQYFTLGGAIVFLTHSLIAGTRGR